MSREHAHLGSTSTILLGNNIPVYTKLTSATDWVSKLIVALNWLIVNYINNVACYVLQQATLFIYLNYRVVGATIRLSGSSDNHKFTLSRIFRCTVATRIALFWAQRCRYGEYKPINMYRCYQNYLILVASVQ